MIRIKTPATSANLAVGFDSVGIALSLYNTFEIHPSKTFKTTGFSETFKNPEDLLWVKAYMYIAHKYKKTVIPVEVILKENHIPISRGLGSSASLIVSGMLASSIIHKLDLTKEEMAREASLFEGHADNVYACVFGELTTVFKEEDDFVFQTENVSNHLTFNLLIPSYEGKTQKLRNLLPKEVLLEDAVYNVSRMPFLIKGFKEGNLSLLKKVLKDKLHQSIRMKHLMSHEDNLVLSQIENTHVTLSGSGPTLLLISEAISPRLPHELKENYTLKKVSISQGVFWEGTL